MKYLRSLLTTMALTAAVSLQATISITSEHFSYSQDFDSLPTGSSGSSLDWTNNSTIPGWYQGYQGSTSLTTEWSFQVVPDGAGLVTGGGISTNLSARFSNLGHANSTDRSVGLFRANSLTGSVGAVFLNNSGMALPGFAVGYTGEQWRRGGTQETSLYFEYQVVASVDGLDINSAPENWTRVDALRFDSPRINGGGLNLDGKYPAHRQVIAPVAIMTSIPEGEFLVIRWHQDRRNTDGDAVTVYHVLAIDDVSLAVAMVPHLAVDLEAEMIDYAFGTVYLADPVADSEVRSVRFSNIADEDVVIETISLSDDADGAFALGAGSETPFTIPAGGSFDVEVLLGAAVAGGANLEGELLIESSLVSDPSGPRPRVEMALTGQVYTAGDMLPLNSNPTLDDGLSGWTASAGGVHVSPGFDGSLGKVRLRGENDLGGPDSFGQTSFPQGGSSFRVSYLLAIPDFEDAVGTAPSGEAWDRSFQFILHSATNIPVGSGAIWSDAQAATAMVNLAYLPAGDGSSGEGFYLYDGETWQHLPALGTLEKSVDLDGNGNLDAAAGDTVNVYQVTLAAYDFGTPEASYDLSISAPNSTAVAATATGLTVSHSSLIDEYTLAAYTFTTGDHSTSSGTGSTNPAWSSSFWIDEVTFTAPVALPHPVFTVTEPLIPVRAWSDLGIRTFTIANAGLGEDLNISSAFFGDSRFRLVVPSAPFSIAPGEEKRVTVAFDPRGLVAEDVVLSDMAIASNNPLNAADVLAVEGHVLETGNYILGSFEVPGTDPVEGTDTFAGWLELGAPELAIAVPGLIDGSTTAAYLGGSTSSSAGNQNAAIFGGLLRPLSDFELSLAFAIQAGSNRQFSIILSSSPTGVGLNRLNIRYEGGTWGAHDGSQFRALFGTSLTPSVDSNGNGSLDDPGDTKVVYRLVVTGRDWNDADLNEYDVAVYDSDGTLLGSTSGIQYFTPSAATDGQPFAGISMSAEWGFNPGFWVDDVVVTAPAGVEQRFGVNSAAFDAPSGNVTLRWNDTGATYYILSSADLFFDDASWIEVTEENGVVDRTTVPGEVRFTFEDPAATGDRHFWRVFQTVQE